MGEGGAVACGDAAERVAPLHGDAVTAVGGPVPAMVAGVRALTLGVVVTGDAKHRALHQHAVGLQVVGGGQPLQRQVVGLGDPGERVAPAHGVVARRLGRRGKQQQRGHRRKQKQLSETTHGQAIFADGAGTPADREGR